MAARRRRRDVLPRGNAARNAVTAVLLPRRVRAARNRRSTVARDSSPRTARSRAELELGGAWRFFVYHKPAPGVISPDACEAAYAVLKKYSIHRRDRARGCENVSEAIAYPGCITRPYRNLLQAKMSIQFVVAATLAADADDRALRDFSNEGDAAS